jgi:hypothetical protein
MEWRERKKEGDKEQGSILFISISGEIFWTKFFTLGKIVDKTASKNYTWAKINWTVTIF